MDTVYTSNLLKLAQEVQQLTTLIVNDLTTKNIAEPSFRVDSEPIPETPDHVDLRSRLNDTAKDLLRLVNGPRNDARTFVCYMYDLAAFQAACEFNFFEAIPEYGRAHVKEIAEKSGVDQNRVGRFMRILATDRVFEEVETDVFQHTSRSVLYLKDLQWRDVMHYQLDEFYQAASMTSTSIKESPSETNGSKNAFVTRHGMGLYQFYQQYPTRSRRFASAMAGLTRLERHFETLKDSYPWDALREGKIVDVGGGSGHMSVALAKAFPKLEFVVQDSASMLASASQNDIAQTNGRVTLMPHDFFTPQPVAAAAAYLLRYITHNWSDDDCVRIFKALVPGLAKSSPGTPLLINDAVLPALGQSSRYHENRMRQIDIMMMLVLGAKQRTESEFEQLLLKADPRFKIKTIHGKGDMGVIEAYLDLEMESINPGIGNVFHDPYLTETDPSEWQKELYSPTERHKKIRAHL